MKTRFLLLFCLLTGVIAPCASPRSSSFLVLGGSDSPKNDVQKVYSKNPEANALYLQGLEYLNKGNSSAGGSILNAKKAQKLFRQAAQKDPQFALAYLGEADALNAQSFSVSGGTEPAKVYRQQEAAALKAVELDDSLPHAHSMLAEIYYDNAYDWPNAERELKRVIELSPNLALPRTRYALFLATMGRFSEAEEQVKLAQAIDEKSASPNRAMVLILYWQHKDDAAIAQGLEALRKEENRPIHFFLGFVYTHLGQFEKAIEQFKLGSFGDADSLAAIAYAYAMAGNKTEFENTFTQLKNHPAHEQISYGLAQIYVALGDKERATSLIEKDYKRRSSRLNRLKVDPTMDSLRQEPRFKELMRKMNLDQ